jgi:hypothetical protein
VILTEITDEEIADELFKARSIELRYYNRSDETAVHDKQAEDNY